MRTVLRLAVHLYPSAWRARYGEEFHALLEELDPSLGTIANVVTGGILMHVKERSATLGRVAVLGAAGLVIAACIAFVTSHRVESRGTMSLQPYAGDAAAFDRWILSIAGTA